MRTSTTIYIKQTVGEWEMIDDAIAQSAHPDFKNYLRYEARKLIDKFKECPDCVTPSWGELEKRRPPFNKRQLQEIGLIAKKMKISPSAVIKKFIIEPMLLPK